MDSFIIMVIVIIENIDTIIVGISFRYLYHLTFFVIFIAIASNELWSLLINQYNLMIKTIWYSFVTAISICFYFYVTHYWYYGRIYWWFRNAVLPLLLIP